MDLYSFDESCMYLLLEANKITLLYIALVTTQPPMGAGHQKAATAARIDLLLQWSEASWRDGTGWAGEESPAWSSPAPARHGETVCWTF